MSARTSYALVGLFVLVLTGALIAGVLWFSAGGPGRSYDEYVVYMQQSVAGLSRDSTVKYYGVDVGRVHRISLGPDEHRRVRLLVQIDHGTPIREDTVATFEVQGLTGLGYINLTGGSKGSSTLKVAPNEDYPVITSEASIWGRLDRSLGELVDNLTDSSERLQLLLSDENQHLITETLKQVRDLSAMLASRSTTLASAIDDAGGAVNELRSVGQKLPSLVDHLEETASAVERMAADITSTSVAVRRVVEEGGRDVKRFTATSLPEIQSLIHELRLAADNLRRFSESLEQDPSVLVYGPAAGRPGPGE